MDELPKRKTVDQPVLAMARSVNASHLGATTGRWAEHWLFLFPLWHGTMPALFKGFLEHIFGPGFPMEYGKSGFPKRLLAGRSARIVVTMGMPALMYRWYFGAYGVRGFERSVLSFAGIKPIRESLYDVRRREEMGAWLEDMRRHGERGD
jgi:putative NADPH-quinone reductase